MEIPRKIEKEEYERFTQLLSRKLRPNEIIYKMHITEERYDLLLQYHWYKRTNVQKIRSAMMKFEGIERQNIPPGFSPWVSKILGVA